MRVENTVTGISTTLIQTTAAPGTGGRTFYSDSGGPFLVAGTDVIVATTITGANKTCSGADINRRVDTDEILGLISRYL